VSRVEYAPQALLRLGKKTPCTLLRLEKDGTDQTARPLHDAASVIISMSIKIFSVAKIARAIMKSSADVMLNVCAD